MLKKIYVCIIATIIFVVTLTGCDIFPSNTDELLKPPALSGELALISKALTDSIGKNYTLKYPTLGNYTSAIVQNDIDGDGILEAFAFYSKTDGDTTMMYINVITSKAGKWESVAQQKIVAGGINRVDFCDLDGDGKQEILVGWEIYGTSEMQLAVYSYSDNIISQRMLQRYSYFDCTDLNEDGKSEIFILNFNPAETTNHAGIYQLTSEGVREISGCSLDETVKTVSQPIIGVLSNGKPAVYIDETKGVGSITEVLFFEKNLLINPLKNSESRETLLTLRSSAISTKDINNDGILEIPVQTPLPSAKSNGTKENLYYTNWCSYNGEQLTNQLTTIMNFNDGYYLSIPQKLSGKIALLKDSENSIREFYNYDSDTETVGERIFFIQSVSEKNWDKEEYKDLNLKEIVRTDGVVHACWISERALNDGITLDVIKENFKLIDKVS